MEQSEQIDQLAIAMLAVQKALPVIQKTHTAKIPTKKGGEYSYKYADLDDCVSASRPILLENDLVVMQPPDGHGLTTQVMHKSGQWMRATMDLHPSDSPQEQGSSITYARRYAWCSTLGLLADEDDDGTAATHSSPASGQQRQQAPQEPPFQGQRPPQAQQHQQQPQGQAQQGKKRGSYSWCNNASPPVLDEGANKPSKGQFGRLFAIAKDHGFDRTGPLVAAMFNGLREDAMDWKQMTYLSDALEDGWRPPADEPYPEEPF